jgi:hypothetical protein
MSRRQRWRSHTKPLPQPVVRPDRFVWAPEPETVYGPPRRKAVEATHRPSLASLGTASQVSEASP